MHKAITIIQFKLEGEIIRRRPEFGMDDRLLLHRIDLKRGTINLDGKEYELKGKNWPTINPKDPYALSIEEEDLMHRIHHSFECSEKLKKTYALACSVTVACTRCAIQPAVSCLCPDERGRDVEKRPYRRPGI